MGCFDSAVETRPTRRSRDPCHCKTAQCTEMQRLLSKGQNLCHLTKQRWARCALPPGHRRRALRRLSRRLCFNTRVFLKELQKAGYGWSLVRWARSETSPRRAGACASQILRDRAENHKRVLFTKCDGDTRRCPAARARELRARLRNVRLGLSTGHPCTETHETRPRPPRSRRPRLRRATTAPIERTIIPLVDEDDANFLAAGWIASCKHARRAASATPPAAAPTQPRRRRGDALGVAVAPADAPAAAASLPSRRRRASRPKDIAAFLAALELPQYAGGFVANGVLYRRSRRRAVPIGSNWASQSATARASSKNMRAPPLLPW